MTNWKEIDQNVRAWIKEAGSKIRDSFQTELNIKTKSNRNDLVTNMDEATERLFIEKIRTTYKDHKIMGEEGFGDELLDLDGVTWILDPIDGTMNFVHQQRNFAISIGVYEDSVGVLGYIYDVVHDELYHAHRGHGAYMNDVKLPDLNEVEVEDSVIALNAQWVTSNRRIDPKILSPLVQKVRGTRSYGSAAIEMAYIAAGRLDAYLSMRLAPWDFAAGKILIEEVGGIVTDLDGNELDPLNKSSLFVAKPRLHQTIMTDYLKR
ncbi:inositol monophosphatase family protein [Rossellomorea aquimaris]|uniref:inositol monophosphatase family protein n=1 Tax=Rossellomorea aquimaris TaxID=189382 RepID=UPI001CD31E4B|nr:inositol monophosphatase family protein [Rossellomorea aquimaris]MCA1053361.1 inositol monophosphatase family protein [Rossellomorea aquimaris]